MEGSNYILKNIYIYKGVIHVICIMKTKDLIIRITWKDYRRAKRFCRPYPDESVAHWFERLVNKIEDYNENGI